ncbi:MAG TPA: hydroxyacid dehydrogenase [Acidimicrobiia bacterium]|nr:hydroxyacid dehydrogenase [Acidimicrobiia bacterium]
MTRIVVSEFLGEPFLKLLRERHDVEYDPDLYGQRDSLLAAVADASAILIRNRTRIDHDFIAAARELVVVGRLGVGLDNIDMEACASAGILVKPATGANAVSVAEYVLGAMLTLLRPVFGMSGSMVAGQWPRQGHAFGTEASGKTLGLLGFGAIARHVARRAAAFDMTIIAHDPFIPPDNPLWRRAERVSFDDLFLRADVLSVHTPLTDDTRNLVGNAALGLLKATAVLINTSRGGVVDEVALASALRGGTIAGAALDVFATEPLGAEPASRFEGLDNLVLTPHLAGNTRESVDRVAAVTVANVLEALATNPHRFGA